MARKCMIGIHNDACVATMSSGNYSIIEDRQKLSDDA